MKTFYYFIFHVILFVLSSTRAIVSAQTLPETHCEVEMSSNIPLFSRIVTSNLILNSPPQKHITISYDTGMLASLFDPCFLYFNHSKVLYQGKKYFRYWTGCNINCWSLTVRHVLIQQLLWKSSPAGFSSVCSASQCFLLFSDQTGLWSQLLFWSDVCRLKVRYRLRLIFTVYLIVGDI